MYKVFESSNPTHYKLEWTERGTFKTFKEAKDFAEKNICKDIFHEGDDTGKGNGSYWFDADNNSSFVPYRVHIQKITN